MSSLQLTKNYLQLAKDNFGRRDTSSMHWHVELLYWLTKICKPQVIVELGTGSCGSFYPFLAGLIENNSGHIYTVDIRDRSAFLQEAKNQSPSFFTQIIGDSKTIADITNIDFLFVDSEHYYEHVMAEWTKWEKHVKVGGLIFFHDVKDFHNAKVCAVGTIVKELWQKEKNRFCRLYNLGAEVDGDVCGLEVWIKIRTCSI